jgi:CDP-glucose 4,6-dehydratase
VGDEPIHIRHPHSVRPWQHVLEPLAGYLQLVRRLWDEPGRYSGPWNFGPAADSHRPVAEVVQEVIQLWGHGQWMVATGPSEPREANCLRLSSDKAMSLLSWRPQWSLRAALQRTIDWYRAFYWHEGGPGLRALCERQIAQYEARMRRDFLRSIGTQRRSSETNRAAFVKARREAS